MTGLLSRFEIECLIAVAENPMSNGLGIIEALEQRYETTIQHSRAYPNLDGLAERGLIEKHAEHYDGRTNAYEITTKGIQTLEDLEETIQAGLERSYEHV